MSWLIANDWVQFSKDWDEQQGSDPVNHPSHYTQGSVECIKAIEASMSYEAFCGYLKGCCEKYIWRYLDKEKPLQDLKKAEWYLNKLIEVVADHDSKNAKRTDMKGGGLIWGRLFRKINKHCNRRLGLRQKRRKL